MSEDLVNVSDLNQYLYCPRRLYYLMFYQTQGMNVHLADGRSKHARQARRGGWVREFALRSDTLHLQGKVDLIDSNEGGLPVERKQGDRFYENDLIQLTAYAMLLEEYRGEPVETGIIYLYGTNRRHEISITDNLRNQVTSTVNEILAMKDEHIPDFCENINKCSKCSVFLYCMPYESRILEYDNG